MKRILGMIAVAGLLTAAPAAFAGVNVFFDFVAPAPVYVAPPPPQYVAVYRWEPRWRERHEYFERREFREHERHHGYYGRGRY